MSTAIGVTTYDDATKAAIERRGCLEASVLSVYDLPYSDDVPKGVTLSACGLTVQSSPPLARHKDRNSFRFSPATDVNGKTGNGSSNGSTTTTNSGNEVTKLSAPLRDLYQATLKIRVVYSDPDKYLDAELPIRQLRIYEQKWLILSLSQPPSESPSSDSDAPTGAASGETSIQAFSPGRKNSVTEEDMSPQPTIRIRFLLSGPYRPEIAALINFASTWFRVVDKVEGGVSGSALGRTISSMEGKRFNMKMILIPMLPILAIVVAASPFLAGVLAVVVPFLFPLIVILVLILSATLLSGGLAYASTKTGRTHVGGALAPLVENFVHSRPGQAMVYDIGPRPTPVSVCRQLMPTAIWSKLWVSLIIDLIGSSSYLLPIVGEGFDLAWAPAQTILIMAMYEATTPNLKYLSFMEEVLPFTDIVPSASIGWACEFVPLILKDHFEKNEIDPNVTEAVSSLMTTAANVVATRAEGETIRSSLQRALDAVKVTEDKVK